MDKLINYRIILKVTSRNLFILGFALASCSGVAIIFSENAYPFIISSFIAFSLGVIFHYFTRKQNKDISLHRRDAYITVTISWFLVCMIGSLPFILSGSIPSFVNAFFESVSGFTTTGSSILNDIEVLPKSILFWRSLTHWIGGIGIIVLVIIIMPSLQIGSYHLFTLESSLQEKIQPRIKAVGSRLLLIYIFLTIAEILFLLMGGMNLYESICHAFGTIATGGFSPRNTSIANYSPYIQYVVMVFMLLSGTNFVIHYNILKGNLKKVRENDELKFYLSIVGILGMMITSILFFHMHKSLEESFREAFFQIISIVTCTGFASADYLLWPEFAIIIIFLAMFIGGSTGSTAGGIKMARHLIFLKNIQRIFRKLLSPGAIFPIRLNKNTITGEANHSILTFISIYLSVFIIGSILLVSLGLDGKTACSSAATCMAGIGPGIGSVGPMSNFAHLPQGAKVILSFLMFIGRLEIYTVLILFTRSFWRR